MQITYENLWLTEFSFLPSVDDIAHHRNFAAAAKTVTWHSDHTFCSILCFTEIIATVVQLTVHSGNHRFPSFADFWPNVSFAARQEKEEVK